MNATAIIAAEIVNELAEMFPIDDPGLSTPDKVVAAKLAELQAMLAKEIEEFEAHLCKHYDPDVPHMYVSAGWGWD